MGLLRGALFINQNLLFARGLHISASAYANVPLSRFEPNNYLPYKKLKTNLVLVQKRYDFDENFNFNLIIE